MACCDTAECCDDWLAEYCDFVPATITSCGGDTCAVSNFRTSSIGSREAERSGFNRNDVHGYVIATEVCVGWDVVKNGSVLFSGETWQIMGGRLLDTMCVWQLNLRSVAACYGLSDDIRVFEKSCVDESCDMTEAELASIIGMFRCDSGQRVVAEGNRKMDERWSLFLAEKPAFDITPNHEFLHPDTLERYKPVRFTDSGNLEPFRIEVQPVPAAC